MKTLSVMTYNIRNAFDDKGENAWKNRRESLVGLIKDRDPDVFCVQEAFFEQICFLQEILPEYGYAGVGRDDGETAGEYSAVFYKKSRFVIVSHETRWLSETPAVPSIGWDAHHKRICTSAVLEDRQSGKRICVASTHLDHAGVLARKNGAELLRGFFYETQKTIQCFIAGDYNAFTDSEPYNILNAPPYSDARLLSLEYSDFGTFHSYGKIKTVFEDSPIDHIFMTDGEFKPERAEILAVKRNGRFPSDHFPLMISFLAK